MIKQLFNLHFTPDFNSLAEEHGIIIYGAGQQGNGLLRQLKVGNPAGYNMNISGLVDGLAINCIADKDKEKHGTSLFGIPIVSPDELAVYNKETPIIITPLDWIPKIINTLKTKGFCNFYGIDAFANKLANNAITPKAICSRDEYDKHHEEISKARQLFSEKSSLEVFDARLDYLFQGTIEPLMKTFDITDKQYFPRELIEFGENEVFVDCGVYDGTSSIEFAQNTRNKYKMIYAFEADETCSPLIKANTRSLKDFRLFNLGVSDKDGVALYSGKNTGGGHITTEETPDTLAIKLTTLDQTLLSEPNAPTYIKMDVEGSEIAALKGAAEIIKNYKPKLAISIYHKPADIWEVPLLINDILPGYRFYLRHHRGMSDSCETVLYAV